MRACRETQDALFNSELLENFLSSQLNHRVSCKLGAP